MTIFLETRCATVSAASRDGIGVDRDDSRRPRGSQPIQTLKSQNLHGFCHGSRFRVRPTDWGPVGNHGPDLTAGAGRLNYASDGSYMRFATTQDGDIR